MTDSEGKDVQLDGIAAFDRQDVEFVGAIREGREPESSAASCVKTMALLDGIDRAVVEVDQPVVLLERDVIVVQALVVTLDGVVVAALQRHDLVAVVGGELGVRQVARAAGLGESRDGERRDQEGEGPSDRQAPRHPMETARHVVVRVTPSMAPMPSVTSWPMSSSVGPSTTAM